ncbi:selenide, water dikinase SelD [Helicobacter cappadocius]|uniref:Selenide, water dikinase SelD n=1 Tax=Helicobacter cappadocius TaxID=3063998 RepID=A0AA90PQ38_9HELI|nr:MULTISPECIES: selenide, water dikinase SelD [unclassified Helicobacter]MDO7252778.1 selenide, water dikinase SelD [Helicobacter sp. faydin-H75]MDP2538646.1 selenide, water dikinase SelD [Helicobacter sp. faydin-H76]
MGLEDLKQITANLKQPDYKNLLLDFKNNDDCGIFRLDNNTLLVQSVDFITPIVDDAYIYGRIAAANSLSDIFAKGAKAISAMSILMWDKEHLDTQDINAILQGSLDTLIECECALLGGHSINDTEQKYGLSVSGIIKDNIFWRNNTAKIGDVIILTKPIGSGILTTAFKNDELEFATNLDVVSSMMTLNLNTAMCAKKYPLSACTDVTGYGLIGHLCEMVNKDISICLHYDKILFFENAITLADKGVVPGGSYENKKALEHRVKNTTKYNDIICYDAQTSGGLLIAMDEKNAQKLVYELRNEGIQASIIAEVVIKSEYDVYLK